MRFFYLTFILQYCYWLFKVETSFAIRTIAWLAVAISLDACKTVGTVAGNFVFNNYTYLIHQSLLYQTV